MRVQEFDKLADWFKDNVLDVPSTDDEGYDLEQHEDPHARTDHAAVYAEPNVKKPTEADDELSLIEYIIGIDEIEA